MSVEIIQERLNSYNCQSVQEEENAVREIAQEIILGGLSRSGFFKEAAFQGGTCLRILYNLERFSEDLDFILIKPNKTISLDDFLETVCLELKSYDLKFTFSDRKDIEKTVRQQILKEDSLVKLLTFNHLRPGRDTRSIKIKIEIDTNPPEHSNFETKYHDYPFAYEVTAQNLPTLFASKSHALLCREYVKGRDWYDFVWYVSRKISLNYQHLSAAINQLGSWKGKSVKVDKGWYLKEMENRIRKIDVEEVKNDVKRFIKPKDLPSIEIWSTKFFLDRLDKLSSSLD